MSVFDRLANVYTTEETRLFGSAMWRYDVKCRECGILADDIETYFGAAEIMDQHNRMHYFKEQE